MSSVRSIQPGKMLSREQRGRLHLLLSYLTPFSTLRYSCGHSFGEQQDLGSETGLMIASEAERVGLCYECLSLYILVGRSDGSFPYLPVCSLGPSRW